MERDNIEEECAEIWNKLIPNIIGLARNNDSTALSQFLGTYECGEVSDGKLGYMGWIHYNNVHCLFCRLPQFSSCRMLDVYRP